MSSLFSPGLVSVTFRRYSVDEIIALTEEAGLECIEWGGDIHVPHGKVETARIVAKKTTDHGLRVASYGSYYRLGESEQAGLSYEKVLESAVALGAPFIRVWAGSKGSADTVGAVRLAIEQDALRIAELTAQAGLEVAFEYHGNTLTDTCESTLALLQKVDHPALKTFWQTQPALSVEENVACLTQLLPWLSNVHVFQLTESFQKMPLREGTAEWPAYLKVLQAQGASRPLLLEFVHNETREALLEDAATLQAWAAEFPKL
ncbi:MAG: TIM barrel protein [Chthoniobacterales bacterium]